MDKENKNQSADFDDLDIDQVEPLVTEQDDDMNDELEDIKVENKKEKSNSGHVVISKTKVVLIKTILASIKENNERINDLLGGLLTPEEEEKISVGQLSDDNFSADYSEESEQGRIIEGVFDGERMIGPDGKEYSMPANYASKSKLVEGDILKLTITDGGTFIYKQIGPIERSRLIGKLEKNSEGDFAVAVDGRHWHILTASVTYFKGEAGDEAVILIPKSGNSKWAAVENIIKNPDRADK